MVFASDQVKQRGTIQFNYVLQIDNGPQTALRGRADDLVQIRKMALKQLSGYSNGNCGISCAWRNNTHIPRSSCPGNYDCRMPSCL
jgi:hypothetical protein